MPRFRPLIALALVALLMMPTLSVAAQSEEMPRSPEDFEGFAYLANRYYLQDPGSLEEAVTAEGATPATYPPVMAIVMVMAFETEGHASTAFEPYTELMADAVTSEMDETSDAEPIEERGDQALRIASTGISDGYSIDMTLLTVREGEFIFLVLTMTANDSSVDLTDAVMEHMLDGEMSDADVEWDQSGASTGGPFALFPEEGDAILGGMDIQSDQYLTATE
jgi:hypothetical protein